MSSEQKKTLEELSLLDRFLFSEAIEDPEFAETMLEIILGKELALKYIPQTEKEMRTSQKKRSVRLDVWMVDQDDVVYDTEVQKRNTMNLPKRSRYYQAMIDSRLLEPGETDFNRLPPVGVIMICPFDIGGKDFYRYTYRERCDECPELPLDDGAFRMFLNTRGKNLEGVSEELVELLHYMEHTTDEFSETCASEQIKKLHRRVKKLRANEEVAMRYLRELEAYNEAIADGRAVGMEEGLAEGREKGLAEGREKGLAEGREKGLAEGRAEGLAEGQAVARRDSMRIFVLDKLEDGVAFDKITEKLQRHYQLTKESAQEYVEKMAEEMGELPGADV